MPLVLGLFVAVDSVDHGHPHYAKCHPEYYRLHARKKDTILLVLKNKHTLGMVLA